MKYFSLIVLFFCFGFSDDPKKLVGNPVPRFSVTSTDSSIIDRNFFNSKVSIITFYSWKCLPCRYEIETLIKLACNHDAKNFSVVIITDDNLKAIQKHFVVDSSCSRSSSDKKKFSIDPSKIKIVSDTKNSLYTTFGVKPTPTMFIVGRDGMVREYYLGFPTNPKDKETMFLHLKEKIHSLEFE